MHSRRFSPLPLARRAPLVAGLLALALLGCAGTGHLYDCDPDAGPCHGRLDDGGALDDGGIDPASFILPAATVWHDGKHISDVDVAAFNGALYASFRHASGFGIDNASSVFVVTSADQGATWNKTAELKEAGRDLREPKISVYGGALHVTVTSWDPSNPTQHQTLVLAASSPDGSTFSALADSHLLPGSEAWRPRPIGDRLWVTAWKADELFPSEVPGNLSIFASTDGQSFNGGLTIPVGGGAHEADLLVRADSSLWAAIPVRAQSPATDQQTFCFTALAAPFSWTCWSVQQAPIDEPALFEFDGVLFVSGGHDLGDGHRRTAIWQVDDLNQSLSLVADLPQSMGETGAPGVIGLDATHALLTYHSTSKQDPRVQALGHEPTQIESQSNNFEVDALAVVLDMSIVGAGK